MNLSEHSVDKELISGMLMKDITINLSEYCSKENIIYNEIKCKNEYSIFSNYENPLLNKNYVIEIINNIFNVSNSISLTIRRDEMIDICENIFNITQYGTKGNIIAEELLKTVFNPQRLIRLSNLYNINIDILLNYY